MLGHPHKIKWAALGVFLLLVGTAHPPCLRAQSPSPAIQSLLGPNSALLVVDETGAVMLAHHASKKLIPASTVKVLTALGAIHQLGPNYRFPTEFYVNETKDLLIKGYGDPLLLSETVAGIARALKRRLDGIRDIVVDDSYFARPITIPGITGHTRQPYNAPHGALCVNFNTVNFKRKNGEMVSAEPQTPMLPTAIRRIRKENSASGRILLSDHTGDAVRYAGELFQYFLEQAGVPVSGGVREGMVNAQTARFIYRHRSEARLTRVIEELFTYSSNYMANQILLAAGAQAYGPPATLDKGLRALNRYCRDQLALKNIQLVEGSGISPQNRISAKMFIKILDAFEPYHHLMPRTGRIYFKTGTLSGVQTRVGYIASEEEQRLYRFAILLNAKGKRTEPILSKINQWLP